MLRTIRGRVVGVALVVGAVVAVGFVVAWRSPLATMFESSARADWRRSEGLFAYRDLPPATSVSLSWPVATVVSAPDSDCELLIGANALALWRTSSGASIEKTFSIGVTPKFLHDQSIGPECTRVAIPSPEGGAIWDLETGKTLHPMPNGVIDAAFSRDGRWLALRTKEKVEIWDADLKEKAKVLPSSPFMRWSPFGADLASANSDGVGLWDANQETYRVESLDRTAGSRSASFSRDGSTVLVVVDGEEAGTYRAVVAHPRTGYAIAEIESSTGGAAISADGGRVAVAGRGLTVWAVSDRSACMDSDECVRHVESRWHTTDACGKEGSSCAVAFSLDGLRVLTAGRDAVIWDAASGNALHRVEARSFARFAFGDGALLGIAQTNGSLSLSSHPLPPSRLVAELFANDGVFLRQREQLVLLCAELAELKRVSDLSSARLDDMPTAACDAVAASADERRAAILFVSGEVRVIEVTSGSGASLIRTVGAFRASRSRRWPWRVEMSSSGRSVAVYSDDRVFLWVEGRPLRDLTFDNIDDVKFADDERAVNIKTRSFQVDSGDFRHEVQAVDVQAGTVTTSAYEVPSDGSRPLLLDVPVPPTLKDVTAARRSRDQSLLFLGTASGLVWIGEPGADEMLAQISAHSNVISRVAIGGDHETFLTVGDGRVKLWALAENPERRLPQLAGAFRHYTDGR